MIELNCSEAALISLYFLNFFVNNFPLLDSSFFVAETEILKICTISENVESCSWFFIFIPRDSEYFGVKR